MDTYVDFGRCGDPCNFFVYANQSEFETPKEISMKQKFTQKMTYLDQELMDL